MRIKLYLKKIFEKKFRLTLITINFALGLILSMLIFTIGFNISKSLVNNYLKNEIYSNVYVTLESEFQEISNSNINAICLIRISEYGVKKIDDKEINIPIEEISPHHDLILPGKLILGKTIDNASEALISIDLLNKLNIDKLYALNKQMELSNGEVIKIVGVYENKDELHQAFVIRKAKEAFSSNNLIIRVSNIRELSSVSAYLKSIDASVLDYSNEIKSINNYKNIIFSCFILIGIGVTIASVILLYSSLKISIKDKLEFIAIYRAIGYSGNEAEKILIIELLGIYFSSIIISSVVYFGGLIILGQVIQLKALSDFLGENINIFHPNLGVYFIIISLAFILLIIIEKKSKQIIIKTDIIKTLGEAYV